jgi:hypothetical protein
MTLVLCLRRLGWSGLTLCSRVSKSERCNNCKGMLSVKGKVALAAVGMFLTIGVMGWIEGVSADQPTPDYYIALGDSVKSRCDNMGKASQVFPYVVLCPRFGNFVIRASGLYE